ncbi:hypothetical protein F5Y02DRAFT_414373 [Annulohypoxylon stygium]|nr:hypothetical protein F5Y02DRAFT_414373 [Annulohypoxylon stygium]
MLAIRPTQIAVRILSLFILAANAEPNCRRDACYNALFPCAFPLAVSQAVDYCSTVGHYGATNFPAQATAAFNDIHYGDISTIYNHYSRIVYQRYFDLIYDDRDHDFRGYCSINALVQFTSEQCVQFDFIYV